MAIRSERDSPGTSSVGPPLTRNIPLFRSALACCNGSRVVRTFDRAVSAIPFRRICAFRARDACASSCLRRDMALFRARIAASRSLSVMRRSRESNPSASVPLAGCLAERPRRRVTGTCRRLSPKGLGSGCRYPRRRRPVRSLARRVFAFGAGAGRSFIASVSAPRK